MNRQQENREQMPTFCFEDNMSRPLFSLVIMQSSSRQHYNEQV